MLTKLFYNIIWRFAINKSNWTIYTFIPLKGNGK